MEFDQELDATGLLCPLPVLKAAKRLRGMAEGSVLKMIADDPAAVVDVPHFCNEQGHTLVSSRTETSVQTYFIRRNSRA
ncbi:MAG: preprotein translocase subunit TatB [Boseongicola sp.]|nr:MAG: preprotein translocase subunit TatB [Boseongicola sp.]